MLVPRLGHRRPACFFCEQCKKETQFLMIRSVILLTGVSRSTIYYWMDRSWIHWIELPSCRRVICKESLSHQGRPNSLRLPETLVPKTKASQSVL